MRAVVQRVRTAEVTVEGARTGAIQSGLIVYLGVGNDDSDSDVRYVANKILGLRIFPDGEGAMNRSIVDLATEGLAEGLAEGFAGTAVGEAGTYSDPGILVVSQFTLYGDVRKGRRPSFNAAAPPEHAKMLYEQLVETLAQPNLTVETGAFQAHMHVASVNDGPVTILIDSKKEF